jgi:hypothetical protein
MMIAAFDVATATGVCLGAPGGKPKTWTWELSDAGDSRPAKLEYFWRLLDGAFSALALDALYYEQPLELRVLMEIGAKDETVALLRGAIGVLEAWAYGAGIRKIEAIPVQAARKALTGRATFPKTTGGKSTAKFAIQRYAHILGVNVETEHEADAFCVWNYACCLNNPRIAHLSTPLFAR